MLPKFYGFLWVLFTVSAGILWLGGAYDVGRRCFWFHSLWARLCRNDVRASGCSITSACETREDGDRD